MNAKRDTRQIENAKRDGQLLSVRGVPFGHLLSWIDYAPTESNPADEPSRAHEDPAITPSYLTSRYGPWIPAVIPDFSDANGDWLSFADIAHSSVWS